MENQPVQIAVVVSDKISITGKGICVDRELPPHGEIILTIAEGKVKFYEIRDRKKV